MGAHLLLVHGQGAGRARAGHESPARVVPPFCVAFCVILILLMAAVELLSTISLSTDNSIFRCSELDSVENFGKTCAF